MRHPLLLTWLTLVGGCSLTLPKPATVSEQLASIKASPPGGGPYTVNYATVTYVIPAGLDAARDRAGFFIQAQPEGPGLYIPADPTDPSFQPYPEPGDVISFQVTGLPHGGAGLTSSLNPPPGPAIAVADYKIMGEQAIVEDLILDLDQIETLPADLSQYADGLVATSAVLTSSAKQDPDGFAYAQIRIRTTENSDTYQVRLPIGNARTIGIQHGCTIRIDKTPLRPSSEGLVFASLSAAEVSVFECPEMNSGAKPTPSSDMTLVKGDALFSELFLDSNQYPGLSGEWVELYNPSDKPIDLQGCVLRRPAPLDSHTILRPLPMMPKAYVTIAGSELPGGMQPDYVHYNSFSLRGPDDSTRIALQCDGVVLDKIEINTVRREGLSLNLSSNKLTSAGNDQASNWCWSTTAMTTYNSIESYGTPGLPNTSCTAQ